MTTPSAPRASESGGSSDGGRRKIAPVELLLGAQAASGGPWSLLGLEAREVTDRQVTQALEHRLLAVNRHPLGGTPEADDVRLALHTAAAQLLHPEIRERLLDENRGHSAAHQRPRPATPRSPDAAQTHENAAHDPMLRIIAMHGGLNERSLRQIMLLSGAGNGSPAALASELHDRLVAWSHQKHHRANRAIDTPVVARTIAAGQIRSTDQTFPAPAADTDTPPAASRSSDDDVDPGVRTLKFIVISALAVIAAASVVLIGVSLLLNKPSTGGSWLPGGGATQSQAQAPAVPPPQHKELFPSKQDPPLTTAAAAGAQDAPPAQADDDPIALVRELAASTESLTRDPEPAAARFLAACRSLATRWHTLPTDQRGAAEDAIVEFLYRAPTIEIAGEALNAVLHPREIDGIAAVWSPARVWAEVWRGGMLARLSRERDLSASVRALIDGRGAGTTGAAAGEPGTFARGALHRLAALPGEMVRPPLTSAKPAPPSPADAKSITQAWSAWRDACRLAIGSDDAGFDRLVLMGLETMLADGPEPLAAGGLAEVARDLTLAVSWRKDSPARSWLIVTFSADAASSADLAIVTAALAGHSAADGVDAKMVLAPAADERARLDLRDAYATAWGMSDPGRRDEMLVKWREKVAAEETAGATIDPADELHLASLAAAVTKARLNLAATMVWAGLIEEPAAIIHDPAAPVTAITSRAVLTAGPRRIDEGGTDGAWALQYLAAEHRVPDRLKLMTELLRANRPLGQVDAAIVIGEATRGSPETVRSTARDVTDRAADSPAVIYAMLQESYRIPRTRQNAELLAQVTRDRIPGLRDPEWYAKIRRLLVNRLLEVLASRGPESTIDQLAEQLARTCSDRAKPSEAVAQAAGAASPGASKSRTLPGVGEAIQDLLAQWRRSAETLLTTGREPFTLEQIDRRLSSRLAMAAGSVQEFSARQVAVAELMAYVISIEQPAQIKPVQDVLDHLAATRRTAPHIMDQIDAAELAMMRLWRIRMQGGTL